MILEYPGFCFVDLSKNISGSSFNRIGIFVFSIAAGFNGFALKTKVFVSGNNDIAQITASLVFGHSSFTFHLHRFILSDVRSIIRSSVSRYRLGIGF